MPERPDLEYVVPILDAELRGRRVLGVRIKKPVVLRVAVAGRFEELVSSQTFAKVSRRAHFVVFETRDTPEIDVVVSPMLAGRFDIAMAGATDPRDLAVALRLDDDRELRYRDDVQMGKVYVVARGDRKTVPGLAVIGVDVLSPAFTRDAFRTQARTRRDQAKVFLMDKSALDAMGNAYADEVLFEAGIHPKAFVRSLCDEDLDRLHDAIVRVLGDARAVIAERKPALHEKIRDFLKVRGRPGEPCVRCKTKLRKAGVHGHDAIFCPECQPDRRGSALVDWRRVPKG